MKTFLFQAMLIGASLFFSKNTSQAQQKMELEVMTIGKKYDILSKTLNQKRSYWVYLPKDYLNKSQMGITFPVAYLLDGELYFLTAVGIQTQFEKNINLAEAEVILVGIENIDRTKDLTPTAANSSKGHATLENSGGGPTFQKFITKELIPEIDRTYATSNRRIFIGHSFGGLSVMYSFLTTPNSFTDYIAIDPSLWWDNEKLLKSATALLTQRSYQDTKLYIAKAGQKKPETDDEETIDKILEKTDPKGLLWKYRNFEDQTHGSVIIPALQDALKFIYDRRLAD